MRSSSPAGRIIVTGVVKKVPSSAADVVRVCPASAIGKSKGDVVSSSPARRGGTVKNGTMPDRKSEGRLQAMAQNEKRGRAVQQGAKRRPVLLVDVMGTIVRDPFHVDMPAFFGFVSQILHNC